MNLGLPPLHGSVPLPPGILSVHVRSLWHRVASRLLRDLLYIHFVVIRPLTVLDLLLSSGENGGISFNLIAMLKVSSFVDILAGLVSILETIVVVYLIDCFRFAALTAAACANIRTDT